MKNSTKKKSDGILLFAKRYTPLQKYQYASYLYMLIYPKRQEVKNEWEVSVKGGYKRTKFGYTTLGEMVRLLCLLR